MQATLIHRGCQTVGNTQLAMLILGGHSFKVKFRPQQELEANIGEVRIFVHGPSFARLQ